MIEAVVSVALLVAFLYFAERRNLRYLHIFQQEEYDPRRYLGWLARTRAIDKRLSGIILALSVVGLLVNSLSPNWLWLAASSVAFLAFAAFEVDPRKAAKKKLTMTSRAKRTHLLSLLISALIAALAVSTQTVWTLIVCIQLIPLTLPIAKIILQPIENRIQASFWREARAQLNEVRPTVVAITGSFGKTSVKHILGHVLGLTSRTLITPGSVNTPMGITRIIREQMRTDCEHFVVEMGAYGPGSIQRLCELAPPNIGIITAIGDAHYERFKDLETVARAKFELADAVLRTPDGRIIIHESVLKQPFAADFVANNRTRFVVCGSGPDTDFRIANASATATGTELRVEWGGGPHRIHSSLSVPIFGSQHIGNIALAFAAAIEVGVPPERIEFALKSLPQIKHRLEVKTLPDGSVVIDDAYNSNPIGFTAALELLSKLKRPGGRSILVTPGMAELGEKHDEMHAVIGRKAADTADIVLLVKPSRVPTLAEAFCSSVPNCVERLKLFDTFADANAWLTTNRQPQDVVLLENDLPDLYESELSI